MGIRYQQIRDDRQWRASTGLNKNQFFELVKAFQITYEDFLGQRIEDRLSSSSNESKLKSYEEYLFFLLYSIKSGLT